MTPVPAALAPVCFNRNRLRAFSAAAAKSGRRAVRSHSCTSPIPFLSLQLYHLLCRVTFDRYNLKGLASLISTLHPLTRTYTAVYTLFPQTVEQLLSGCIASRPPRPTSPTAHTNPTPKSNYKRERPRFEPKRRRGNKHTLVGIGQG